MKKVKILAAHFLKAEIKGKVLLPLYVLWLALVIYAAFTGQDIFAKQSKMLAEFQHKARESWDANPDKHPHRMAHFGSFAFRVKHPLSKFDNGMESYTGNAVYMEAHKQNTVNFSEAGFSTSLLRFGEISLGMLLQTILPLILFFMGFRAIAEQKENGTLKILLGQGTGFKHIILGYTTGLFTLAIIFLIPVLISVAIMLFNEDKTTGNLSISARSIVITIAALAYLWIISAVTICVSATSATSRAALLKLLGIWLVMVIVLPKTLQAIGSAVYPSPGKIEFETAVEAEILKQGDSHNPDDPFYKQLKDSVLKANQVSSVQDLSFNYSGFQMREGERKSASVYNQHLQQLYNRFQQQNQISYNAAILNPVIGFKNLSIALCGSDFTAYRHFQQQAEAYRYHLAQTMNELQIKYISNKRPGPNDKPNIIDRKYWTGFPDFEFRHQDFAAILKQQVPALISLILWLLLSGLLIHFTSLKANAL